MSPDEVANLAKWKLTGQTSCVGCKFLYLQEHGYSSWTVTETTVNCALDRNPKLPAHRPFDWAQSDDNWHKTQNSRCEKYAGGPTVTLDVDGEDPVSAYTDDPEVLEAIAQHSGRRKE